MLDRLNYVLNDEAKKRFVTIVSENTGNKNEQAWWDAIRQNKTNILREGWACEAFLEYGKDKVVLVLGASPSLKNQIDQLKELSKARDTIIIGLSSGLSFLAENNIKPRFVFVAEVVPRVLDWFKGIPEDFMKDTTLIADIHTNPAVMDLWKGEVKYLATFSAIAKMDKKVQKWLYPVNGCNAYFPALGAQVCSAVAFSNIVLDSPVTVFAGMEFSFPSVDGQKDRYYPNRIDEKDFYHRGAHLDIYGNVVYTTFSLLQTKYILEDWCGKMVNKWFFNATEAGILGVSTDKHIPWIHQFSLPVAMKQARHTLIYGEPLRPGVLKTPTMRETAIFAGGYRG